MCKQKTQLGCVVIAATLLFHGCFLSKRISKNMDSWVGTHQSELIRKVGPPERTASDGAGGVVLIYERQRALSTDGSPTKPAMRMFYVNPDGIIYHWRWRGL